VVAAVVVTLPFLNRPVALPVLARLWRKGGAAKTVLARQLIETIAAAVRGRVVHVVAVGAYLCKELRRLPPHVTLTGPLRSNASLWHVHPDLDYPPGLRGRGRPRAWVIDLNAFRNRARPLERVHLRNAAAGQIQDNDQVTGLAE
jgi:hypothetical protein